MKYDVHLYTTVRVKIPVEADSQIAAIEKAESDVELGSLFRRDRTVQGCEIEYVEWAEETASVLVDEDGDEDYENSQSYYHGENGWQKDPRPCPCPDCPGHGKENGDGRRNSDDHEKERWNEDQSSLPIGPG